MKDTLLRLKEHLSQMKERPLTDKVLIPLFKALGFHKVDYHGGPNEKGRDLICWRRDELDMPELAVAQVKLFKPSAASASKQSFAEVVNQLQQALETPVASDDGHEYLPSLVYFVTPFSLDARALESRFVKYETLRKTNRVKIIDGDRLCQLASKHVPAIVREILGASVMLSDATMKTLTNRDLFAALNRSGILDLSKVYCDLHFAVGRITSKFFFSLAENPQTVALEITSSEFSSLMEACKVAETSLGFMPLDRSVSILEDELEKQRAIRLTLQRKRVEIEEQLKTKVAGLRDFKGQLVSKRGQVRDSLEKIMIPLAASLQVLEQRHASAWEQFSIDRLPNQVARELDSSAFRAIHAAEISAAISNLPNSVEKLLELIKEQVVTIRRISELEHDFGEVINSIWTDENRQQLLTRSKLISYADMQKRVGLLNKGIIQERLSVESCIVPTAYSQVEKDVSMLLDQSAEAETIAGPLTVSCKINGRQLHVKLLEHRDWIMRQVKLLRNAVQLPDKLPEFLDRCSNLLAGWDNLLTNEHIKKAIGLLDKQLLRSNLEETSLYISLTTVFKSGRNVVLYGSAGAGKTTTLQMYAYSLLSRQNAGEFTVYAPLAQVVLQLELKGRLRSHTQDSPIVLLEDGICSYLQHLGVPITSSDFGSVAQNKRTVFIFDGIDEAVSRAPWIVEALLMVAARYPNAQILTSSREGSPALAKLHFLGLTLQPFTPEQRDEFIRRWFEGQMHTKSREILSHLGQHTEIAENVTNPLNATILCVLAESGVPLPKTEIRLHEERLRLLLGHYDIAKRASRIKSNPTILEAVAHKLAFGLHLQGLRYAPPSHLRRFVTEGLRSISADEIDLAVSELCDPCNVLIPVTEQGEQGFGHLRFQEYLVSKELSKMSIARAARHLSDPWWRGAFVFLAQGPEDIDRFIDYYGDVFGILDSLDTLKAMIEVREAHDGELLLQRLEYFADAERTAIGPDFYKVLRTTDSF